MIYLLWGEDGYRIKQETKKLVAGLKAAGDPLITAQESPFDLSAIAGKAAGMSLFGETNVFILENPFKEKRESQKELAEILESDSESTIFIFISAELDRKSSLYERLKKEKVEEFPLLKGPALTKWINDYITGHEGKISASDASLLSVYFGSDLYLLKNEIDKLLEYDKTITKEAIEQVSVAKLNIGIFNLIDAVSERNASKAKKYLVALLASGENELYILAMIERHLRNLIMVSDEREQKKSEQDIATSLKLHPFVVKKTNQALSRLKNKDDLNHFYELAITAENDIKSGGKEPRVALELLVAKLAS